MSVLIISKKYAKIRNFGIEISSPICNLRKIFLQKKSDDVKQYRTLRKTENFLVDQANIYICAYHTDI